MGRDFHATHHRSTRLRYHRSREYKSGCLWGRGVAEMPNDSGYPLNGTYPAERMKSSAIANDSASEFDSRHTNSASCPWVGEPSSLQSRAIVGRWYPSNVRLVFMSNPRGQLGSKQGNPCFYVHLNSRPVRAGYQAPPDTTQSHPPRYENAFQRRNNSLSLAKTACRLR